MYKPNARLVPTDKKAMNNCVEDIPMRRGVHTVNMSPMHLLRRIPVPRTCSLCFHQPIHHGFSRNLTTTACSPMLFAFSGKICAIVTSLAIDSIYPAARMFNASTLRAHGWTGLSGEVSSNAPCSAGALSTAR